MVESGDEVSECGSCSSSFSSWGRGWVVLVCVGRGVVVVLRSGAASMSPGATAFRIEWLAL